MIIKYIFSGFLVKLITGFDDTMTHIPIVANITRTKHGRIAFSLGILGAITVAIIISLLFAATIKAIPYYRYISASLVLALAFLIYFDVLVDKPKKKAKQKIYNVKKRITLKRFTKLFIIGFFTAFATVIDDTIAYSSIFLSEFSTIPLVILGIYLATAIELVVIIYFSKKIRKFKYMKKITTIGLIILSFLIFFEVL